MIITYKNALERGIPSWDIADPGEQAFVPCWPTDDNGNAVDCVGEFVLVGVLVADNLFRAEEEGSFNPKYVTWICGAPKC